MSWLRACFVLEAFKDLCCGCVGGGGCKEGGELGLSLSRGSVAALVFRTLRWPVLLGVKEGRTIKPTDGLEWRLRESG